MTDLLQQYPYKIELHAHTKPASGCSCVPPEEMIQCHKALGYDAIVVTNHFTRDFLNDRGGGEAALEAFLDDYHRAKAEGDKIGMKVLFGMEFKIPATSPNEYLIYGIEEQFVVKAEKCITDGVDTLEEVYARLKDDKNLIIQAHPFRDGMELKGEHCIDGFEMINTAPGHNSRPGPACQGAALRPNAIVTAGSDTHYHEADDLVCLRAKTLPEDSFALAEILKSRDYLFQMGSSVILPYGMLP